MVAGVHLMVVGMVTVFGFLGLLVGLMQASAAFWNAVGSRYPEGEPAAASRPSDGEEIAVVLAAVEDHRRKRPAGSGG